MQRTMFKKKKKKKKKKKMQRSMFKQKQAYD